MRKQKITANFIQNHITSPIQTALVLGSGLGVLSKEIKNPIVIPYKNIPNFPLSTVEGHAGQIVIGNLSGQQVLILQGRFHYYEGYDFEMITYPLEVLALLGIKKIILTNAAGAVNINFKVGSFMLIEDHINFVFNKFKNAIDYPSSEIYNNEWIKLTQQVAQKLDIYLEKGIYQFNYGPTYETPAEINMARYFGADAVGMSTVPEALKAASLNMKILGISYISNMAAGVLEQPICHSEIFEVMTRVKPTFIKLVKGILSC